LRILPEVESLDPVVVLSELRKHGKWDGDYLLGLVRRWLDRDPTKIDDIAAWLWHQLRPERSVQELSYFHYVLEHLQGTVSHERFFTACARWPAPELPKLVDIPAGEFWMGSPEHEPERDDHETRHRVKVSAIELCPLAVTNAEYERFDRTYQRELLGGRLNAAEAANNPVVDVSWWEARLYCAWLGGRLPTEAEWEYACRAGTETPFWFGKNVTPKQVNYDGNYPYTDGKKGEFRMKMVPVGMLPANAWGIHEMHGNVHEWCLDWYGAYQAERTTDPEGPSEGQARVVRGGCWCHHARDARSAFRTVHPPGVRYFNFGFRLVRGRKTGQASEAEPRT
jgi:formylglycine-generating enzyme